MPPQEVMATWHALLAGREEARDTLLAHFYPILVDTVWLNSTPLTDQEDIEDIKKSAVLTVLMKVLTRPTLVELKTQDADGQYGELFAYLKTAARNQALNLLGRREHQPQQHLEGKGSPSRQTEEQAAENQLHSDRRAWLYAMLEEELTPEQVIVILLRLADFSFSEIAEMLDIGEKAAQDRHRRAVNRLRGLAGQNGNLQG